MKAVVLSLLCLTLLAACRAANQDKCYALVLSTGGDKGAYQAGAIAGLVNGNKNNSVQWDVVTGIGAGAINAGAVASFAKGDEVNMAKWLLGQWTAIKDYKAIYKGWFWGLTQGLYYEKGLYNTEPLRELLKKNFKCQWKRKISLLAANIEKAESDVFLIDEVADCNKAIEYFMATSALPVHFPYITIDGHSYVDGGVLVNMDIGTAIKRCLEIVDNEEDIVLDVILAKTRELSVIDASKYKSYQMIMRYLDVAGYKDTIADILHAHVDFPNVNFRYLIKPSGDLPSSETPLDFGHKGIVQMISMGQKDAAAALAMGPGKSFEHGLKELKTQLNKVMPPKVEF